MKVTISTIGKFQLFNLAQQLLKRDYLARLISSYPKFEVVKYGIPRWQARSIVSKEILQRGWSRLPAFMRNVYNPTYAIHELFDILASRSLVESDILVGTSSSSLYTIRQAHRMGMLTIVERASAHILYQNKILKEEYEKEGILAPSSRLPHQKIIEKELQEYEEADYISVPSFFTVRTFLEYGIPDKKIIHVPYGVDIGEFRQIPKNDRIFRVIFAGNMSFQKGVHYLLQAFYELRLPNAELLLVGSMADEIRPFFKKYEGSFRFIGHVPQKELYKYYSESSVFTMMSIQDGFGLVQAQAMACGLPVIATTNTGGEDIIRDGKDGFIIPIRDIEALKEKLLYLHKNQEICRQMGQSAKERISEGFTWDDYGNKMIKAYENILKT